MNWQSFFYRNFLFVCMIRTVIDTYFLRQHAYSLKIILYVHKTELFQIFKMSTFDPYTIDWNQFPRTPRSADRLLLEERSESAFNHLHYFYVDHVYKAYFLLIRINELKANLLPISLNWTYLFDLSTTNIQTFCFVLMVFFPNARLHCKYLRCLSDADFMILMIAHDKVSKLRTKTYSGT